MLIHCIKGTELIQLLGEESVQAFTDEDSLLIDPEGYSVFSFPVNQQTNILLVKVLDEEDPKYVAIQLLNKYRINEKWVKSLWIEESNDNKAN